MKFKYIIVSSIIAIVSLLVPASSIASSSSIIISEMSMGNTTSATEEFVEMYNNSDAVVNISGWSLYYRSATGTTYVKRASFSTTASIQPRKFYLASTNLPSDTSLISGMSQTGGVMELRDDKGIVVDRVGYGNATLSNGKPSVAVQAGESLYRQYDAPNFTMVNTNDNFLDFYITGTLTPSAPPAPDIEDVSESVTYPNIMINELLPNPAADLSESNDEFIELYNPNQFDVDLTGWLIKDSSDKSHIVKGITIAANSYATFYSADTHISLNNTGDVVRLYSPNSELKDETQDYGDAKEGLSWGLVDSAWAWNTTPTPNISNSSIYVEIVPLKSVAAKSTIKKAAIKKAAAVKKTAVKKPKVAKLKSAKNSTSNNSSNDTNQPDLQSKFANLWPVLLIVLGTGTIGYGIYEYRPEISTVYYKLKNKLGAGR